MTHLKSFFLLYRSMILQWVKSTEALKRCHWQHRQQQQQQLRRYRHKSQPQPQQQQQQQDEIPIGLWPPRVTGAWNLIWRQVGGEVNSQLYRRLKTFISLLQMSFLTVFLSVLHASHLFLLLWFISTYSIFLHRYLFPTLTDFL